MLSRSPRVLLSLAFAVSACSSPAAPEEDRTCGGAAPYAAPGPYPAAVTTVEAAGTLVELWYPATPGSEEGVPRDVYDLRDWLVGVVEGISDEDAPLYETTAYRERPAAEGRFPLLLFSHGLGSYRSQSSFLTAHLASWGFVVAAPDHRERGIRVLVEASIPSFAESIETMRALLTQLVAEDTRAGARLFGRIDTARLGIFGHSAGAATAFGVASDPRVAAWAGLAGGKIDANPGKPVLFLAASRDVVVPAQLSVASYDSIRDDTPKRYLELNGAGHQAFADICDIAVEHGGLLGLADKYGLAVSPLVRELAEDGCRPSEVKPARTYPVTQHFVTAHFRWSLDVDDAPTGLDDRAAECFGTLISARRP